MGRGSQHLLFKSGFNNAPVVHHRNPVGNMRNQWQIVTDQKQRQVVALLHGLKQIEDLRLKRRIDGTRRLIGNQQPRFIADSERDPGSLTGAARQLERVQLLLAIPDPDLPEKIHGFRASVLFADGVVSHQRFNHVSQDCEHWIQCAASVLEDHPYLAASNTPPIAFRERLHPPVPEKDFARLDLVIEQAKDSQRDSRFSAPGFAHQRERFSLLDLKRHAPHRANEFGGGVVCDG